VRRILAELAKCTAYVPSHRASHRLVGQADRKFRELGEPAVDIDLPCCWVTMSQAIDRPTAWSAKVRTNSICRSVNC
jgi:hypothetical protein